MITLCGSLIKKIRKNQKITQSQLYMNILSKSGAINFEHDRSNISVDKLFLILSRLSINIDEFFYLLFDGNLQQNFAFLKKIETFWNNSDWNRLYEFSMKYKDSDNEFEVILSYVCILYSDYIQYKTIQKRNLMYLDKVKYYLYRSEEWFLNEIKIYSLTFFIYDSDVQKSFFRLSFNHLRKYISFSNNEKRICTLISNHCLSALYENDIESAVFYFSFYKHLAIQEIDNSIYKNLCLSIIEFTKDKEKSNKLIITQTKGLDLLGFKEKSKEVMDIYKEVTEGLKI